MISQMPVDIALLRLSSVAHRNAEARVEMRLRRRMTAIIDAYTSTRAPTVATWNKDWAGRFEPPMDTNIVGDSNDTYPNTKYSA